MKKVLFALLMMTCNSLSAQTTLNESGVYEMKEVVQVDGVNAQTLYLRALEALSDWTGTEGRSKFGIDHQDKESATIIYKGKDYLGFRRYMMYGWYIFADFTLCLDILQFYIKRLLPITARAFQIQRCSTI